MFTPHNTLGTKERPTFNQQRPALHTQNKSIKPQSQYDLPLNRLLSDSPRTFDTSKDLSELGDSSSLFSYNSPASFDFGSVIELADSECPIPFIFGASKKDTLQKSQSHKYKMVKERSPAKPPLKPVAADEPLPKTAESAPPTKTFPSGVPKFGQPTLPQSPLRRAQARDSTVFLQPKSRPELHRDSDKNGTLYVLVLR